jgi:hypothetical protein
MNIVKIKGGLANQLFQWAFSYSLSKKFGVKDYYDISFYSSATNSSGHADFRNFCLPNLLNEKVSLLTESVVNEFRRKPLQFINEPADGSFIEIECDENFSYCFDGYWQDHRYIKDYRDEIISSINFEVDHDFDFTDSCSIHVRRGDYLRLGHMHPVLELDYYQKALDIINPNGNIYVFSDDIAWCKKELNFKNMVFVEGNSNINDLKLMSFCSNNITANSSFSWWAAWLNKNENKKVVCPKKWFTKRDMFASKIPNDWVVL